MARKKKPQPASIVTAHADPAELAASALGAGRFRDAIEHFKESLKRERRSAWLEGLAAAYAGRAEQLAAKGMIKEALALWRTRADACGVPLLAGPYLGWMMKSGQVEAALGLLAAVNQLPAEAQDVARAQLAPAVLVAPEHLLSGLPADSLRHRAAARAALAASVQGDEAALGEALQAISFRSPYRDLRPLLKTLALLASGPPLPAAATAALEHVPAQGPFEPLAQAIRVGLMPGTEWLAGLRQLDDAGRTLVLELKGCPPAQRALVLELMARAGEVAPAPLDLLDLVYRQRRVIGDAAAREVCLSLLPHAPQRLNSVRGSFLPLTAAEDARVLALAAELKRQPEQAEAHWLRLVKSLRDAPGGQRRAALVLRRLADEHSRHSADGSLCVHARDWLAQSLQLDPTDRSSHLRLVRDARLLGDLKRARSWLEAAREQFPADAALLLEAVEVALAAGAFKRAIGLARQVLQADPINTRVRTLVGQAHLSHARKQIEANKSLAARHELDEAATWLRSAAERGHVNLLRGFVADSADESDALWRQAVAELGAPLVGALHLLREGASIGRRTGFERGDLLRRAGIDPAAKPEAADVVALAHALNKLPERDAGVRAALDALRATLETAAGALTLSETEHVLLGEALHRQGQPLLTRRFAEAALKRWPGRPVFIYLEAAARFGAAPDRMPEHVCDRLDLALDQAQAEGDHRTAARLEKLLDAADFGDSDDDLPIGTDGVDADELREVMTEMLALGGEDAFIEMARQQLGKAIVDSLRREVKGGKKQFVRALIELLVPAAPEPFRPSRIVVPRPSPPRTAAPAATTQPDLFDE